MKRSVPRLVAAKIMLKVRRVAGRRGTGVFPPPAWLTSAGRSDQARWAQWITAPSTVAAILRQCSDSQGLRRRVMPFEHTLGRPLRGEAPATQIVAQTTERRRDAKAGSDQVAHRLATPECPKEVELVRAMPGCWTSLP